MSTTDSTLTLVSEIPSTLVNAEPLKGLAVDSSASLVQSFAPHFSAFYSIVEEAKAITDDSPKAAGAMRKRLVKIRTGADKTRSTLKTEGIRIGKAIEGINNLLLNDLTPLETRLEDIEKREERREAARITALAETRRLALLAFVPGEQVAFYDLGNMPVVQFDHLLNTSKLAKEAADAALKRADEERIAKIRADEEARAAKEKADAAERARLAEENRKLAVAAEEARKAQIAAEKKAADEQAKRDAQAAKEKAARDAEAKKQAEAQKVKDDALKAEQAKKDAAAAKERANLAAKAKAAQDALDAAKAKEDKRIADEKAEEARKTAAAEAAKKAAAKAPDKAKLTAFAAAIKALPIPVTTDVALNTQLSTQVSKMVNWLEGLAAKL